MSTGLRDLVPTSWASALEPAMSAPSFTSLCEFIDAQERDHRVFPPRASIFAALEATPLSEVKAVILGQDPYPTAGNANGLAFSVSPGVKIPASLKNIFLGVQADLGHPPPTSGDLTAWAKRGVLLLNTVLTVNEGAPNSHQKKGWEPFTEAVVKTVNAQPGPIVFLCFGKPAQAMAERLIDTAKHHVLCQPHPSPLNGRKFVDSVTRDKIFSKTNALLAAGGRAPIEWSLS